MTTDYTKLRTHADLDAALSGRAQPEGWTDKTVKEKQEWLTKNEEAPVPAPAAGNDAGAAPAPDATQNATTEENPASTTRADDPERDSTMSNTTTAEENAGVEQPPNSNDLGAGGDDNGALEPEHNDEQAQGNRHSHPAQTTAEASLGGETVVDLGSLMAGDMPAGEAADPANQPAPGEGPAEPESRHDESGALQDATRASIGAGAGAPDGVGDDGADPSESEVNDQADIARGDTDDETEVAPGLSIAGGKLRLWRQLEKGGTRDDLLKASGYRSVEGTVAVLAQYSGRKVERTKNDAGEYFYKLAPLPETDASV